jgi:hypothetical protein
MIKYNTVVVCHYDKFLVNVTGYVSVLRWSGVNIKNKNNLGLYSFILCYSNVHILKSIYQPKNAIIEIQFMISTKLLHVSALGCNTVPKRVAF